MPSIGFLKNITHRIKCGLKRQVNAPAPSEFDLALQRTPAPQPGLPLEAELIEALREVPGCVIPDGPAVLTAIQPILSRLGDERAAEAMLMIVSRLVIVKFIGKLVVIPSRQFNQFRLITIHRCQGWRMQFAPFVKRLTGKSFKRGNSHVDLRSDLAHLNHLFEPGRTKSSFNEMRARCGVDLATNEPDKFFQNFLRLLLWFFALDVRV
jgi:hypothetical protein